VFVPCGGPALTLTFAGEAKQGTLKQSASERFRLKRESVPKGAPDTFRFPRHGWYDKRVHPNKQDRCLQDLLPLVTDLGGWNLPYLASQLVKLSYVPRFYRWDMGSHV